MLGIARAGNRTLLWHVRQRPAHHPSFTRRPFRECPDRRDHLSLRISRQVSLPTPSKIPFEPQKKLIPSARCATQPESPVGLSSTRSISLKPRFNGTRSPTRPTSGPSTSSSDFPPAALQSCIAVSGSRPSAASLRTAVCGAFSSRLGALSSGTPVRLLMRE